MGVLVGSTLGLTGAVYQTIFANPLATPSTVGTTAGAALGALFVLVFFPTATFAGMPIVAVAAFGGALTVTAFISSIAASGRARVNDVLLAGIAISLAASALTTGVQSQAGMGATFASVRWALGHLAQVGFQGAQILAPIVAITALILLAQIPALQAMVAGEDRAHAQGVNIRRLRTICLGVGALGVGACVAWCGPIAFVGLIVPHIVRLTLGAARRVLLPASMIFGGAFLVLCDTIGRVIVPSQDLPVGVVTAAIGAPLLVALIVKRPD
jgi:iron complex transport system permease protein